VAQKKRARHRCRPDHPRRASIWDSSSARGKRRERLEHWFDAGVQHLFCFPWEAATGLRWAKLLATLRASGRAMPIKDSLMAATALVHGLIVATRNGSDFEKAHIEIIDPFGV